MISALQVLNTFTIDSMPDLDTVVLGALELFSDVPLPEPDFSQFKKPLVVGSGAAIMAGRIIFAGTPAVFADESSYKEHLSEVDGAVLISASGSKHAIEIAETLKSHALSIILLTNNQEAPAGKVIGAEHCYIFPKNREPYTNNTSTYLGMILSKTGESAGNIKDFIMNTVPGLLLRDLSTYSSYTFIVPKEYGAVANMVRIKFEEMFEPIVHGRAYTEEDVKHAKTVVRSGDELFISLGVANNDYGLPKNRLCIPLPENSGAAAVMAVAYYVVGKIQAAHPPYFKNNIVRYTEEASKIFGHEIKPIVE